MRFQDIPKFTRSASYAVDIPWAFLLHSFDRYMEDGLNMDPDFQRPHVWDDTKRIRYVEFMLRGGHSSRDIYTNCPDWSGGGREDFVLVDGKQRLEAALRFMRNELPVLGGHLFKDFTDRLSLTDASFRLHVNDLQTRAEVLQWYLDLNTGGVVHTESELDRVRELLEIAKKNPSPEDLARVAAREAEDKERQKRLENARRQMESERAKAFKPARKK